MLARFQNVVCGGRRQEEGANGVENGDVQKKRSRRRIVQVQRLIDLWVFSVVSNKRKGEKQMKLAER